MKKKTVQIILNLYSKIRKVIEPLMFNTFSDNLDYANGSWEQAKELDITRFSKYINTFPYLQDKAAGLFDMSFPPDKPDYFFSNIQNGRDCDDYARIWALYLQHHSWEDIQEVIVLNYTKPFETAHVITIAKNPSSGFFYLFNYEQYGNYETAEEAIKDLVNWKSYDEDNLIYCTYKTY